MEEQGYIEIKFESLIGNTPIKPNDLDIAEIKEIISDVETFLYPSRGEKAERPHISYNIEEGSVRNLFYLPIDHKFFVRARVKDFLSPPNQRTMVE